MRDLTVNVKGIVTSGGQGGPVDTESVVDKYCDSSGSDIMAPNMKEGSIVHLKENSGSRVMKIIRKDMILYPKEAEGQVLVFI